ncbi:hypothetical protein Q3G72_022387 [Acer saccharum]|nr:hypothetical protein Q3G72_022387 [Acer saccharum]
MKEKDCKIHPFSCVNDPPTDGFGVILHEIVADPKSQIDAYVYGAKPTKQGARSVASAANLIELYCQSNTGGIDYAPLKTSLALLDLKEKDCKIHLFCCINNPHVDGFGALLHEIVVDPKNQIDAFVYGDPQP